MEPKAPSPLTPKPASLSIELSKAENTPAVVAGEILLLTDHGCIIHIVRGPHLKVGDNWLAKVRFPQSSIQTEVKVIKTYDRIQEVVDKKNLVKVLNIELHFRKMTDSSRQMLLKYLEQNGPQKNEN